MMAGRIKEILEERGHNVTIYTAKNLAINKSLFENDCYILKSKKLFYLYAAFFLEAHDIPVYPNPGLTYKHKNRMEAHFLIKKCGFLAPEYYFGTLKTLKNQLKDEDFPLILKPTMGSGSIGIEVIKSIEELKGEDNSLIYLEKYLKGTHYCVYWIDDEICSLEKPTLVNEHVNMTKVPLTKDIEDIIIKWKNTYDLPFGHLDLVREESTNDVYVVDPGNFPEFTNWKCEGDATEKVCNILLNKLNKKLKDVKS